MRVLFLAMDAFGGLGGIAQYSRDMLRSLCTARQVSEVVAVPRRMPAPPESLPPKLTYLTGGLSGQLKYVGAIIRLLGKSSSFDLVCCGHIRLLPMALLAKLVTGAPLVLIIYGVDAWEPIRNLVTRYFLSKIDYVISISEITRQRFLQWSNLTQKNYFLLPNGIIQGHYGAGAKSPVLLQRYGLAGKTVLMTLGRLAAEEKYKGFDEVMDLLPALASQIPTLAYLIVGDGDDRQRLEAKARSRGIEDRVVFAGFIPEAEKADHYRLADAFVMPGRGEGFGFVFLEALACGIPVLGSTLDGSREALRGGTLGILVDPRRPEELQTGILAALKRPRGVIPEGLDYFSFENFEKRCHEILRQVITSGEDRLKSRRGTP
jgi:phosphatidyl-myo-inositol dimannoside synthase